MTKLAVVVTLAFSMFAFIGANDAYAEKTAVDNRECHHYGTGETEWCNNYLYATDSVNGAWKFTHRQRHKIYNVDAWWLEFIGQQWEPDVSYGEPYYKYSWALDNAHDNQVYWTSDYLGEFLGDYSLIYMSMDRVRAEDNSNGTPSSNLQINSDFSGSAYGGITQYTQASYFELHY